jgi:hypothetical protein
MISLLLAMYPARWRRRYGEEFRAMLESRPLGPFDVADVLLGALDARLMRFRLARAPGRDGGTAMTLRIGGFGAVLGGAMWFLGIFGMSSGLEPSVAWVAMAIAGNAGLLVALMGLSSFQAHREPRLAWAAFAIPGLGTLITIAGLVGYALVPSDWPIVATVTPWGLWFAGLLTTLFGSLLFAIATLRAEVLSRWAATSLAVSVIVVYLVAFAWSDNDGSTTTEVAATTLAIAAFAGSWVSLGLTALRRGPIRAVTAA